MNLRPETRSKMKKVREDVDKEIREEAVKEKKEEVAEDKKAARRKAELERVSRLSAAEQKKVCLCVSGSTSLLITSASDH